MSKAKRRNTWDIPLMLGGWGSVGMGVQKGSNSWGGLGPISPCGLRAIWRCLLVEKQTVGVVGFKRLKNSLVFSSATICFKFVLLAGEKVFPPVWGGAGEKFLKCGYCLYTAYDYKHLGCHVFNCFVVSEFWFWKSNKWRSGKIEGWNESKAGDTNTSSA